MKPLRICAMILLAVVCLCAIGAGSLSPYGFGEQNRNAILAAPSLRFPLGTDDLGRDVFSRLLYGSRVTLLIAPASALVATAISVLVGSVAALAGGIVRLSLHRAIDLFLSVPWLFLLLIIRAMLPLNVSPPVSVLTTFVVLGAFGWAASARVVSEAVSHVNASSYIAQSRAQGVAPLRRLTHHVLPNLKSVIAAQFWICVPVFIIGEANLGFLGLGVGEPVPSWGNLLRQLENYERVIAHPWLTAPLCVVVVFLASLRLAFPPTPFATGSPRPFAMNRAK